MPEDGVPLSPNHNLLTSSEVLKIARIFVDNGVKKIRLTGGEPTLRKDLMEIVAGLNELRAFGLENIGITTNGVALKRRLCDLHASGLNHINISLDTLDKFKFELMTRRRGLSSVLQSIQEAVSVGFDQVKINVVIINRVNDDELTKFVEFTRENRVNVRFIEYMPFNGNKWNGDKFISYKNMLARIRESYPDIQKLTDDKNDTTKAFKVSGFKGQFGFISSMSEHFCGTCNRLRILADGNMKVCLFGNSEVNLRDIIRSNASDSELLSTISAAVKRKKKQHAGMEELSKLPNRPMILIGDQLFPKLHSRLYSTSTLTHVDASGKASMVNISQKTPTIRRACATSRVSFTSPHAFNLLSSNAISKGDVLTVAQIAGIQSAKATSTLIPLCHPIPLSHISVKFELDEDALCVNIEASVETDAKTGVEVEAMTAACIASVTIFDMCKGVDKRIRIDNLKVLSKSGGSSDTYLHMKE